MGELNRLYEESTACLREKMLPFWSGLRDNEHGGFYGLVTDDLKVHKDAVKGCILNSRLLWFFSSTYRMLREEKVLDDARHAYRFLKEAFVDREYGGVFWSVQADGTPMSTEKYCYCQAFAVYGLAAYAQADASAEALSLAYEIFDHIETKMRDEDGYLESFDRQMDPIPNVMLSENGVTAFRTMNTALHLLEAYTELYLAGGAARVRDRVAALLDIFLDRMYFPSQTRLGVFFDQAYHSLIDLYSYGHDIEAAWLIDRALAAIGDYPREKEMRAVTKNLTASVYREAYSGDDRYGSLPMEAEKGVVNSTRVWWVQAEAVNGFLNGVQRSMEDNDMGAVMRYAGAADRILAFVRDHLIDSRLGSEWFYETDENGRPNHDRHIADEWKCPYHNGRMILEIMRRLNPEKEEE